MIEFRRLLVEDGHVIIAVPFLQPFHPTPLDFRRYTRTGLEQLAERTGFTILHIWPVHSLAQTLGWIIWAYLEETKNRLGKYFLWLPIYLMTYLFQRASRSQTYTANGFQVVMVKKK
jgi:hypothetical protein